MFCSYMSIPAFECCYLYLMDLEGSWPIWVLLGSIHLDPLGLLQPLRCKQRCLGSLGAVFGAFMAQNSEPGWESSESLPDRVEVQRPSARVC